MFATSTHNQSSDCRHSFDTISDREQGEEKLEYNVPFRDASHGNSVRTDDNRMNFEFMSKDNSNINLIMNNHNVDTSITTPDITQCARNLIQTDNEHEDEVYTKYDNSNVKCKPITTITDLSYGR